MKNDHEPRRIRRTLKWVGTGVCALILGAWGVSLPWGFGRSGNNGHSARDWGVTGGLLLVKWYQDARLIGRPQKWFVYDENPRYGGESNRYGFEWPAMYGNLSDLLYGDMLYGDVSDVLIVVVPLWCPLLVFGVPTALLFWRDRRRIPPGHCQKCGYDLTGNVSGICSECGTPIAVILGHDRDFRPARDRSDDRV